MADKSPAKPKDHNGNSSAQRKRASESRRAGSKAGNRGKRRDISIVIRDITGMDHFNRTCSRAVIIAIIVVILKVLSRGT